MPHPSQSSHHTLSESFHLLLNKVQFGDKVPAELYADIAEDIAGFLVNNSRPDTNRSTQLRRFYDELCFWNEKVNRGNSAAQHEQQYQQMAPLIKMLKAKVNYAKGRKHVDEYFCHLLCYCLNQVKSAETLKQCKLFFEAFTGFYKALRP